MSELLKGIAVGRRWGKRNLLQQFYDHYAAQKHCDDYINDAAQPECLRRFLRYNRWPATYQIRARKMGIESPELFADYGKHRWRVVMASRMGDVGITRNHNEDTRYSDRVFVSQLKNFSDKP